MTPDRFLCWSKPDGNIQSEAHIAVSAIGYTPVALNGAATLLIGTDTRCIISADRNIALIGMVFDRDNRAVTRLKPPRTANTGALVDWLFQNFWGSYVAVMADPKSTVVIARDPSATAQCYLLEAGDLSLAGNRVRDMVRIAGIRPSVDWVQAIRHLMAIQYRSEATSLAGIIELLPGSMRCLTTGSDSEMRWTPWRFADREKLILHSSQAEEVLRQAILSTSKAWASQFRHGVLCLSGGLDSSILAAALVHGGLSCTAVNFLSGTRTGNEYHFAKTVADTLAIPLEARSRQDRDVDITRSHADHLPRPTARSFWQAGEAILSDITDAVSGDALFHGGGGDNVFCFLQSVAPILDRLQIEGPDRGAVTTLRDVCTLTGCSLSEAALKTIQRLITGRKRFGWSLDDNMLTETARTVGPPAFDHPWLQPPNGGLAGSAAHIALILAIQNYLEGYRHELTMPVISPLLSQPVVETCLRIPSWMWCEHGLNRAVARKACADLLPSGILARRSKGTPDGYLVALFERHRKAIRCLLHEGNLAGQGLLDLDAVDRVIGREGPVQGLAYARILSLCDMEAWSQSWH